jgi:hypothetical protein
MAMDSVRGLPGVKEALPCEPGTMCEEGFMIFAEDAPSLVPQLVRTLDGIGISIKRMTVSAPSLDDVFLKFTGRTLRVEEAKPAPSRIPGRRRRAR